jgi:hypothetical protein
MSSTVGNDFRRMVAEMISVTKFDFVPKSFRHKMAGFPNQSKRNHFVLILRLTRVP